MIRKMDRYRVVLYLRQRSPRGCTRGEIQGMAMGSVPAARIQEVLDELVAEGLAVSLIERQRVSWNSPPIRPVYYATIQLMCQPEPIRPSRERKATR